jgi:hypothetical protein
MADGQLLSLPGAAVGSTVTASATPWTYSAWNVMTTSILVCMVDFIFAMANPGVDVTHEVLVEIGTGVSGAEVTVIQMPYSYRPDTNTAYYHRGNMVLPDPLLIPQGVAIYTRAASSKASAVFQGIKIGYCEVDVPRFGYIFHTNFGPT